MSKNKWYSAPTGTGDISSASNLTTGSIPVATGNKEIGDSIMTESSGKIGINTDTPTYALDVEANASGGLIGSFINLASSNPQGLLVDFPNGAPNSTSRYFIQFEDSSTVRARIDTTGGGYFLGDVILGSSSATSGRELNISNTASTTAVNLQITNGSSGTTASDGFLVGIDANSTPNAELVNFEASELRFKTNNLTAGGYDEAQNLMCYGNGTNGGSLDITNVTTGTGSSATFDALRFLAADGSVITGPLSGKVFITMVDGSEVKTIQYRYLNTGDGTTNQVANLADQAQTGTNPWSSTAVVADGSGVKIQLTTSTGRTSVTTICRFIGVRGVNA